MSKFFLFETITRQTYQRVKFDRKKDKIIEEKGKKDEETFRSKSFCYCIILITVIRCLFKFRYIFIKIIIMSKIISLLKLFIKKFIRNNF